MSGALILPRRTKSWPLYYPNREAVVQAQTLRLPSASDAVRPRFCGLSVAVLSKKSNLPWLCVSTDSNSRLETGPSDDCFSKLP